jgi:transposase
VKDWKRTRTSSPTLKQAFVPLAFPLGETCQFDWSHETAVIGGVEQLVKVAHFRVSYSRQMCVIAYPREPRKWCWMTIIRRSHSLEEYPNGMVYDNLKTVVDAIFVGKERRVNRRFLTLANHYLYSVPVQ